MGAIGYKLYINYTQVISSHTAASALAMNYTQVIQ